AVSPDLPRVASPPPPPPTPPPFPPTPLSHSRALPGICRDEPAPEVAQRIRHRLRHTRHARGGREPARAVVGDEGRRGRPPLRIRDRGRPTAPAAVACPRRRARLRQRERDRHT